MKYRFHSLYELDSLAVVNARDIGTVKNAFKILMFPDTRMYQTDNPKAKVGSRDRNRYSKYQIPVLKGKIYCIERCIVSYCIGKI